MIWDGKQLAVCAQYTTDRHEILQTGTNQHRMALDAQQYRITRYETGLSTICYL